MKTTTKPTTLALHTATLTGLLSLALLPPAFAADFSGSLKGVTITDALTTNKPPVATFTHSINGDIVTFNAGGSYDSDGAITKYTWNFGDGSSGEGVSVTHQYSTLTTTFITLTVVDDKNGVAIAQQTIAKSEPKWLGDILGKTTWALIFSDSQETTAENGVATNAFDNNPSTIWHTAWSTSSPTPPHELQIDLKSTYTIDGLRYLARQNSENGRVCKYEFYVSNDTSNWGIPVSTGSLANISSQQDVTFTGKNGRYVRFRAMSECNNNAWTSMSEIDFRIN
jgi:PKD repeat protein